LKKKIVRIATVSKSLNKLLGAQIEFIKEHYDIVLVSQNEDNGLIEFADKVKLPYYSVNLTRKISPIEDIKALYRLYKILKKEKPQIVHTHTPKAGLIGMLAAWLTRVPNRLHTVAGMPLTIAKGFKYNLLVILEKLSYFCATKVYFNSKGLMQFVIKNKISNSINKFHVIGKGSTNGVDVKYFSKENFNETQSKDLKESLKIAPSDFIYLFVGRIVEDKGINELIFAFKKLSSQFSNVKLLMLGRFENNLNPILPENEKEIYENPNILYVGHQKDVRPYFAISDVMVFPSYREGFPNVVLQAGAMEVPVIASNINGNNEIIEDNVNGLLVPFKDHYVAKEVLKEYNKLFIKNRKND